ncbi:MAG: flippase-like domain-containing protein [Candidatus Eisenbacteria sp.]|nr:flippase-like domain-containing protein [Candidatus Eisenbacteria bacterium]
MRGQDQGTARMAADSGGRKTGRGRFWRRPAVSRALKIGISGLLFAFILWKADLAQVVHQFGKFKLEHALWGTALFALSNIVGAYQWDLLLKGQGIRLPLRKVMSFYFVGLYFSNFLPANLGGDVIRVYDVHRSAGNTEGAVAATFFDRLFGLVALAILAVLAALSSLSVLQNEVVMASGLGLAAVLAIVLCVTFNRSLARQADRALRPLGLKSIRTRLKAIYESAYAYRSQPKLLWAVTGIAIVVQILRVLVHYEVAVALGIDIPMRYYFLFIPVIAILIALPVSINGIGVRENAGVFFFRQVGVTAPEAFSMGFLAYVVGVVVSLVGGVLFLVRGRVEREKVMEVKGLGEPSRQM